jgi:hypothetical protein
VSTSSIQITGFTLLSTLFVRFVYFLARRLRLSFRYALGWLLLFVPGFLSVVLLPLTEPVSKALAITPAALLAVSFMIVLVAICIQLSISISGLQEQVRSLSEEVAQLGLASDAGVEEK